MSQCVPTCPHVSQCVPCLVWPSSWQPSVLCWQRMTHRCEGIRLVKADLNVQVPGVKRNERDSKSIKADSRKRQVPLQTDSIRSYFILFHPISTFYKVNLMCEEYSKNLPFTLLHWFPCDGVMGVMRVTVLVPGDSWPVVRGGHRWSCP